MTVVSLLNSGANVQTEDEVYIFFSYNCPHLNTMGFFHSSIFMFICATLWSFVVNIIMI